MQITLSPENATRLSKHCELIGWSPEESNHLLPEPLDSFDDPRSGSLKQFLGAIHYPDLATAQRALTKVAQIVTIHLGGKLPASFQGQVHELELDAGHFGITAEVIGRHGDLLEVC